EAEDFVIATGETHTVREFCEVAFAELDMNIEWHGKDVKEKGTDSQTGKTLIEINPRYFRPTEVDLLIGDYSKAREKLGWEPKVKFDELARMMAQKDYEKVLKRGF
ncbi:MAG: GDP-mannose 4,6-dehydratase, partial [bacterium]